MWEGEEGQSGEESRGAGGGCKMSAKRQAGEEVGQKWRTLVVGIYTGE